MEIIRDSDDLKIGLYNLEPNIYNSAMMQVSQYHKNLQDDIYIALCFMISMIKCMLLAYLTLLQKVMYERT